MIRGCHYFYGLRHATLQFICRIGVLTGHVGSMTPEEAFSGKKPEVGHFRIFGCITYSYVPFEKRTKLEPMAERGIFVGYSETSKDLCIYLPSLRKTVLRRDVRFEEDRAFRKSRGTERGEKSSSHI
jgi:hypothetical protein